MNSFMKMLDGLKTYMYESLKLGTGRFPVAGATGASVEQRKIDVLNATKSKRVMKIERGSQPEYIKARRFERNKTVHLKRFKPTERTPSVSK